MAGQSERHVRWGTPVYHHYRPPAETDDDVAPQFSETRETHTHREQVDLRAPVFPTAPASTAPTYAGLGHPPAPFPTPAPGPTLSGSPPAQTPPPAFDPSRSGPTTASSSVSTSQARPTDPRVQQDNLSFGQRLAQQIKELLDKYMKEWFEPLRARARDMAARAAAARREHLSFPPRAERQGLEDDDDEEDADADDEEEAILNGLLVTPMAQEQLRQHEANPPPDESTFEVVLRWIIEAMFLSFFAQGLDMAVMAMFGTSLTDTIKALYARQASVMEVASAASTYITNFFFGAFAASAPVVGNATAASAAAASAAAAGGGATAAAAAAEAAAGAATSGFFASLASLPAAALSTAVGFITAMWTAVLPMVLIWMALNVVFGSIKTVSKVVAGETIGKADFAAFFGWDIIMALKTAFVGLFANQRKDTPNPADSATPGDDASAAATAAEAPVSLSSWLVSIMVHPANLAADMMQRSGIGWLQTLGAHLSTAIHASLLVGVPSLVKGVFSSISQSLLAGLLWMWGSVMPTAVQTAVSGAAAGLATAAAPVVAYVTSASSAVTAFLGAIPVLGTVMMMLYNAVPGAVFLVLLRYMSSRLPSSPLHWIHGKLDSLWYWAYGGLKNMLFGGRGGSSNAEEEEEKKRHHTQLIATAARVRGGPPMPGPTTAYDFHHRHGQPTKGGDARARLTPQAPPTGRRIHADDGSNGTTRRYRLDREEESQPMMHDGRREKKGAKKHKKHTHRENKEQKRHGSRSSSSSRLRVTGPSSIPTPPDTAIATQYLTDLLKAKPELVQLFLRQSHVTQTDRDKAAEFLTRKYDVFMDDFLKRLLAPHVSKCIQKQGGIALFDQTCTCAKPDQLYEVGRGCTVLPSA